MPTISLGEKLIPADLYAIAAGDKVKLNFGRPAQARVRAARSEVEAIVKEGKPVYGINTGFGALANESIEAKDVSTLQRNLLLSHAVGCGEDMPEDEKRLALVLRLHSLCKGYSGVRPRLIRWFMRLFEIGWLPRVPQQGSVGASGDLAPLAHLALPIIGAGELVVDNGGLMQSKRALKKVGLEPIELAAKEGLALINGVQISNAIGLCAIARMRNLSKVADIVGALSVEALMGSHAPFAARVTRVRPHPGAKACGSNMRDLLRDSEVEKSHADCERVQDPYSFRCIPQVHGSAKDALAWAESVLMIEADSATDNPLVFPGRGTVSAGNFHGHPIAMAMDFAVNALCAWGNMSERRTSNLLHPAMNNKLPAFLSFKPGINSGLMMPQVTAAALCAENKLLATPASADTIPTSADQEDHVSMSNNAARKLRVAVENTERILAIELYCSCQAREFHRSIKAGLGAQAAHEQVRKYLPRLKNDRYLAPELDKVHELIRSGEIVRAAESAAGELRT